MFTKPDVLVAAQVILTIFLFISCSASKEIEVDKKKVERIDETEIYFLSDFENFDTTGVREKFIEEINEIFPADYFEDSDTNYVFVIQIGAFAKMQKARELANAIPEKYSRGKEIVFLKKSALYLVQIGPFTDRSSAQKVMDQLLSEKVVNEGFLLKREK